MGKYLDMARKFVDDQEGVALVEPADFKEMPPTQPISELSLFDHLTSVEQDAYHECVGLMTSDEYNMPLAEANQEAARLVARNKRLLQIQQARQDYERYGYIKIFSTHLDQAVYFTRDDQAAKPVPDRSLPVFTEAELECLQGLAMDEAKTIMEVKIEFGGSIVFQDQQDAKKAN